MYCRNWIDWVTMLGHIRCDVLQHVSANFPPELIVAKCFHK